MLLVRRLACVARQHGNKSDVATGWNDVMRLEIPIEDHHSKVWKHLAEYNSQKPRDPAAHQLECLTHILGSVQSARMRDSSEQVRAKHRTDDVGSLRMDDDYHAIIVVARLRSICWSWSACAPCQTPRLCGAGSTGARAMSQRVGMTL